MEDMPGMAAAVGFGSNRGSNTILRGGFMDDSGILAGRRADRYRIFSGGAQPSVSPNQYIGSSARRQRMAAGNRQNFFRSSRVNNFTMRPRAFGRFHSLSVFGGVGLSGGKATGAYTPFMGSQFLGKIPGVASFTGASGEGAFGPGLLSFISAGTRADRLEGKAYNQMMKNGKIRNRTMRKLVQADSSITRLAGMNNPGMFSPTVTHATTQSVSTVQQIQRGKLTGATVKGGRPVVAKGQTITLNGKKYVGGTSSRFLPSTMNVAVPGTFTEASMVTARQTMVGSTAPGMFGQVGVRGNLMASSIAGIGTQTLAGYFRGAMGYGRGIGYTGLEGAAKSGAKMAEKEFAKAFLKSGLGGTQAARAAILPGQLYKSVGIKGMSQIATSGGAKVLAARGIGLAIPGLQVLAAASFAYDLGKMGGEIVKSGINLARDAAKSIQGSIYKPLFGMGYVDTEAAATSRSRGVMAIQNSRLNARSMLGSEAGMMAARYG
jgi:hypothetical protein